MLAFEIFMAVMDCLNVKPNEERQTPQPIRGPVENNAYSIPPTIPVIQFDPSKV